MPLPWLIGAAAVAIVTTVVSSNMSSTTSNRREKEDEAKDEESAERKESIQTNIRIYKEQEEKRFKEKYNVAINFIGRDQVKYENGIFYAGLLNKENKDTVEIVEKNDSCGADIIENLENEVDDIIRLIGELEVMKYEAIA